MNFIRTLQSSSYYDIDFLENVGKVNPKYETIVNDIKHALIFSNNNLHTDFYISHECMHLDYEQQFVRIDSKTNKHILTTTHLPWIGERTRQLHGAHVEFCKQIDNPIGIKVSDNADPSDIQNLIETLNPTNEPGKIVIVIRMGAKNIHKFKKFCWLNKFYNIVWLSDPMHGNTKTVNNVKTRYFRDILVEYKIFESICLKNNISPGGIHVEMTGEKVTECVDANYPKLEENYKTLCDPRLNRQQSIELMLNL